MTAAGLLLCLLASPAASELEAPPFTVIFTPPYRAEAERIAAEIPAIVERQTRALGSPPLAPAELHLLPESGRDDPGREGIPSWAAGVALPHEHRILIWPDRIGRYTQRHLLSVVAHETAHLVAHRAAGMGAHHMPPWFREGVASNLAREGEWLDFFYLWASPISSSDRPLEELSGSFGSEDPMALTRAAYAGSYSFVRFIEERHSPDLPASVLAGLREGLGFETAYARAAGVTLRHDEAEWAATMRGRSRWVAIVTSSFTLWLTITLLATLAWLRKRRRTRMTMERWTEEDPFE